MLHRKLRTRSLEINLATHCNLKCFGCGRGSPAFAEEYYPVDALREDLTALSTVLEVQEFKLAGGEPTLHAEILDIVDVVRHSGITDHITLITNGVRLHEAPKELWRAIDGMWVSVYPGVRRQLDEAEIMALGERYGVVVRYKVTDEFNYRMINRENADKELVEQIYSTCYQTSGCHSVHKGRYYKCASGPFIPQWLETAGTEASGFEGDGVDIHGAPNLRAELKRYLWSSEPLRACHFCVGGMGKAFVHHQVNREGLQDWLSDEHSDIRSLLDLDRLEAAARTPKKRKKKHVGLV